MMNYKTGKIHDVIIRDLSKYQDNRGWLMELFRSDIIAQEFLPAMSYISQTEPGVARGPHEHEDQADFFCFIGPSTFRIYLWDARKDSPSFGQKMVFDAGEQKPQAVIVPAGVVHAYRNIGPKPGWVINLPNRLYAGKERKGPVDEIRHESDPHSPFQMD
ncbi:MAG: dTDP-4-dehydrorhamnose 3,5-epimerase family protein [Ignavibacteriales bacterium]|nr:dTDP-4-dehydrorhamnose 3,5-epimerase family protein [Ignavibacteriales bacterium]